MPKKPASSSLKRPPNRATMSKSCSLPSQGSYRWIRGLRVGRGESGRDKGGWIYEGIRKRMRRGVLVRPTSPRTPRPSERVCVWGGKGRMEGHLRVYCSFFVFLLDSFGFVLLVCVRVWSFVSVIIFDDSVFFLRRLLTFGLGIWERCCSSIMRRSNSVEVLAGI